MLVRATGCTSTGRLLIICFSQIIFSSAYGSAQLIIFTFGILPPKYSALGRAGAVDWVRWIGDSIWQMLLIKTNE